MRLVRTSDGCDGDGDGFEGWVRGYCLRIGLLYVGVFPYPMAFP